MNLTVRTPFVRNRLTWLAYALLAYLAFTQSMFGPILPFLRDELQLTYTLSGLLPAAVAAGLVLSGLISDRLAHLWGRRVLLWGGAIGIAAGAGLLGVSHLYKFVFVAALVIGTSSSLTQVMIQAILSDQHGERRSIAYAESNVAASLSTTLTPLFIGLSQRAGLGWRAVTVLPFIFLISLALPFSREAIPNHGAEQSRKSGQGDRLSLAFWMYWIVIFLVVAIEMALAVWATEFFASVAGMEQANAAFAFGSFPAAMVIGRLAGSRLTRRWPNQTLLLSALGLTLVGFPIFWLSRSYVLNILGLFITGLGVANLYPLTLSLAVGMAPGKANQASARASLGVGSALLTVPLFLGWLADRFGLQNAYGINILFVAVAFTLVMVNRLGFVSYENNKSLR